MKGITIPIITIVCVILIFSPVTTAEWNDVTRLTFSGSAGEQVVLPDGEECVHVIFQEKAGARYAIKYMKLGDNGDPLLPSRNVISDSGESIYPAAALDDAGIHLLWWDNRDGNFGLFYSLLDHNGSRMLVDKSLGVEYADDKAPQESPHVALDSLGNAYVVWSQQGAEVDEVENGHELTPSVFFMKLDIWGEMIVPPITLSSGYANGIHPDIVLDIFGRAHVVWSEDITGNYEIYYTIYEEDQQHHGHGRSNIARLTDTPMESLMGSLLYLDGNLYITWSDGDQTGDIYTVHFAQIQKSRLINDIPISGNGNALYPAITTNNDQIFITWQDDRHSLVGSEGRETANELKDNLTSIKAYLRRHLFGEQDFDTAGAVTNWEIYLNTLDRDGTILVNNSRITTMHRASISPEITVNARGEARIIWVDMSQSSGDLYYIDDSEEKEEQSKITITTKDGNLAVVGGIGFLFLIYIISGEGRRYAFLKYFVAPLYSTISRDRLMENENRRQIIALINQYEGITFTTLMDKLGLKNGALAYHLYTLERRRYIKSVKDGKYRRFYPRGARITGLSSLEEKILNVIRLNPSITQREIANLIESTPQTVNYNIKKLIQRGVVYLKKDGKHTRCHLTNPTT